MGLGAAKAFAGLRVDGTSGLDVFSIRTLGLDGRKKGTLGLGGAVALGWIFSLSMVDSVFELVV
jgi:hypothetical protein